MAQTDLKRNIQGVLNQYEVGDYPYTDIYISFLNQRNQPVRLNRDELELLKLRYNGNEIDTVTIDYVSDLRKRADYKLTIALVIDNSGSMINNFQRLKVSAIQLVDSLKAGDQVSIFDFGKPEKGFIFKSMKSATSIPEYIDPVHAMQLIDFSTSKKVLKNTIAPKGILTIPKDSLDLELTPRTSLYDALGLAGSRLKSLEETDQKVIICFSDGENNAGVLGLDFVKKMMKENSIPIFSIDFNSNTNKNLQDLSSETKGRYYKIQTIQAADTVYQGILKLLENQIRIRFKDKSALTIADSIEIKIRGVGSLSLDYSKTITTNLERNEVQRIMAARSAGTDDEKLYLKYLEKYGNSFRYNQVMLLLGDYYKEHRRFYEAFSAFHILTRYQDSESYSKALIQMAQIQSELARFDDAQATLKRVSESEENPSIKAQAIFEMARNYSAQGKDLLAKNAYKKIVNDFPGTELASSALLQTASLSMDIGDLSIATTELSELVDTYKESKNTIFAKMTLADVAAQQGQNVKAIEIYLEIVNEATDNQLRSEASLRQARLLIAEGRYKEAVPILDQLVISADNPGISSEAIRDLVTTALMAGDHKMSRNMWDLLDDEEKTELLSKGAVQTTVNDRYASILLNGAMVTVENTINGDIDPIEILSDQDLYKKYPVLGPIYRLPLYPVGSIVSIPIETSWLEDSTFNNNSMLYANYSNQWEQIKAEEYDNPKSFRFEYTKPGIIAIMSKKPQIITLYNMNFDVDKAEVRKGDERNLFKIIDDMKEMPDVKLEITGHTDSTGDDLHNLRLSEQRAISIRNFMIKYGIKQDRLISIGYGRQYPVASNSNEEGRSKNRRTEFTVIENRINSKPDHNNQNPQWIVQIGPISDIKHVTEVKTLLGKRNIHTIIKSSEIKGKWVYHLLSATYREKSEAIQAGDLINGFIDSKTTIVMVNTK